MPTVTINGQPYEVQPNQNLIMAAAEVGIKIPHYCYHPGLTIDGNCRMCLVEIKGPRGWMAQIACNTLVSDGLEVCTDNDNVKKMQQGVLEFLLLNHPIDCPICDQAGECKLQDYYMDYGRYSNRSTVPKVHKDKGVHVGPLVVLDQERCILCSRCVRFCEQISRSHELVITGRGENCRIETFPGVTLDNPYSGNVVDICPVGALTSTDFRFKMRVWYLSTAKSVCTGCARGCNIDLDYSEQTVYRYRPRYNPAVNQYWMCDRGRLSYKQIHENRLLTGLTYGDELPYLQAIRQTKEAIQVVVRQYGSQAVGALASSTASLEDNFVLRQLVTQTLDSQNIWGPNYVPPGEADDFLRLTDQTANTKGLEFLGIDTGRENFEVALASGNIRALVILDNPCSDEKVARLINEKVQMVIYLSTQTGELVRQSAFALPVSMHAEHYASYVNAQNILQKVYQAYAPESEAEPGWMVLSRIAHALDSTSPDYQDVESVWTAMRAEFPGFGNMTFYKLPDTGLNLEEVKKEKVSVP